MSTMSWRFRFSASLTVTTSPPRPRWRFTSFAGSSRRVNRGSIPPRPQELQELLAGGGFGGFVGGFVKLLLERGQVAGLRAKNRPRQGDKPLRHLGRFLFGHLGRLVHRHD